MRCLVTGGAGFIGSWICRSLVKENHKVICLDNLITGKKTNIPEDVDFINQDITKKINLDIDMIFHLASMASPKYYGKYPIETLVTNAEGTRNLLDLAKEKNARFLLASTSEVYGDPLIHPQPETYWGNVNPIGIRSCYDEGKRYAEALSIAYHRVHGLDIRIARIFNTYGPGMMTEDGRALPNFISQALTKKPITIYGDGNQTRSFCYISDMVDGLKKLMFKDNISGSVINLGNPQEIKILDLAKKIKALCKSDSKIIFKPLPKDDPKKRRPDISLAKKILGWEPKVGLDEGLLKTIQAFEKIL
jgi:nucleoside-diphosphate-sugar epimerase